MASEFASLACIPDLRLTPRGIVKVSEGRFITQEEMNQKYEEQEKKKSEQAGHQQGSTGVGPEER